MSHCEYHETSLSTLIDGELESVELLPAIDHLVDCSRCREFYRGARALERMVVAVTPADSERPASEEIWHRIDAATRPAQPEVQPRWRRDWRSWGSAVAASVVLSFGLWAMLESGSPAGGSTSGSTGGGGYVDVVLEQNRGEMSDQRFVELTAELLRADERYHRKMYEVMDMVTDGSTANEGTAEGGFRRDLDELAIEAFGEETGETTDSSSSRLPV